jgi:hypothetical protein
MDEATVRDLYEDEAWVESVELVESSHYSARDLRLGYFYLLSCQAMHVLHSGPRSRFSIDLVYHQLPAFHL